MSRAPRLRPPLEYQEQIALMDWARLHEGTEPRLRLLHHCPNGEKRDKGIAVKLQRMGVRPDIPDIFLPCPMPAGICGVLPTRAFRQALHGCYVEMKRTHQRYVPQSQLDMHAALRAQGYAVGVARGWVEAAHYLCWYLDRADVAKEL